MHTLAAGAWPRSAPARSCSPRAGLLDGRRATTHWAFAAELARTHPQVEVEPDPIFVRDGSIWTSAGVTAGMDLALALVEEDHDRELALLIARHLVLFLRRPGNQSQFSAVMRAQQPRREPLREVQREVLEDVAGRHTVEAMAERAHMSPRHFARAFRAETGVTPARYVESVRLEAARRRLEETAEPVAGDRARLRVPERRGDAPQLPAHAPRRPDASTGGASTRRTSPHATPSPTPKKKTQEATMKIAIALYDRFTALDAIGPYEVLSRLPGARVTFVAAEAGPVRTDNGMLTIEAERALARSSRTRRRSSSPAAPARSPSAPASRCSTGCAPPTARAPGRPRSAPAR